MTPSIDTLAEVLARFPFAMLTVMDRDGQPRTRPMKPLATRFNGHIWFRAGADAAQLEDIGRGAEVCVAYGGAATAPCVTVYGWAIVLRNSTYVSSLWQHATAPRTLERVDSRAPLICVTARAAELWEQPSSTSARIFAFSNPQPAYSEDSGSVHELARELRRASAPARAGDALAIS